MSDSDYVKLSELAELAKLDKLFSRFDSEAKLKQTIADKIIGGKKLSVAEREIAYKALTGTRPCARKGKGRTSTIERDAKLAVLYTVYKDDGRYKRKSKKLKLELAEILKAPSEINSIDSAIRKGKKYLREQFKSGLSIDDLTVEERRNFEYMVSLLGGSSGDDTGKKSATKKSPQ